MLDAAERQLDTSPGPVTVDVDLPDPQLAREPVRLADVASPDGRDQAVVTVVCDRGRLLDVRERRGHEDWTEDLVAGDRGVGPHSIEQGRLEVETTIEPFLARDLAPRNELPLGAAELYVALDALVLVRRDDRPEIRVLVAGADRSRVCVEGGGV
jgi:hypothetical protein